MLRVFYFLKLTFAGAVTKGPDYGAHLWHIAFRLSCWGFICQLGVKTETDLSNVDSFVVLVVEHLKRLNNLTLHLRGQHLKVLALFRETVL